MGVCSDLALKKKNRDTPAKPCPLYCPSELFLNHFLYLSTFSSLEPDWPTDTIYSARDVFKPGSKEASEFIGYTSAFNQVRARLQE